MNEVIISKNEDGSSYIDMHQMAMNLLAELRDDWRRRHLQGSELEDEYSEIKSQGSFYSARF